MRKKTHTRRRAIIAAFLLAGLGLSLAQGQSDERARKVFNLTNQDRQQRGLPALHWDTALAAAAQAHADRMVREPALSHQYPGEAELMARAAQAGAHFRAIAENVAMGPSPEAIENEWMHSTPHRTNILDPKMNAIGVAVAERGGSLYAVEDFAQASAVLSRDQVVQQVQALLRAQRVDPSVSAAAAEQACQMDHGMPPGTNARSMVRFQTPDLSQLPSQVVQQIRAGGFTRAAVGACAPQGNQTDFTLYRIAILFY